MCIYCVGLRRHRDCHCPVFSFCGPVCFSCVIRSEGGVCLSQCLPPSACFSLQFSWRLLLWRNGALFPDIGAQPPTIYGPQWRCHLAGVAGGRPHTASYAGAVHHQRSGQTAPTRPSCRPDWRRARRVHTGLALLSLIAALFGPFPCIDRLGDRHAFEPALITAASHSERRPEISKQRIVVSRVGAHSVEIGARAVEFIVPDVLQADLGVEPRP